MNSIRLSKKYGVNPAIPLCLYCGREKNQIILPGFIKGDIESPKNVAWDMEPCDECKGYMEKGVILISVKDTPNKEEQKNPYRTGGWIVITEEAAVRIFGEKIKNSRMAYVTDEAWDKMGFPRT